MKAAWSELVDALQRAGHFGWAKSKILLAELGGWIQRNPQAAARLGAGFVVAVWAGDWMAFVGVSGELLALLLQA